MCKIPFEKVFATKLFAINGLVSDDSGQITANMELFHFSQAYIVGMVGGVGTECWGDFNSK